jgi:hypothetical protein
VVQAQTPAQHVGARLKGAGCHAAVEVRRDEPVARACARCLVGEAEAWDEDDERGEFIVEGVVSRAV